MVLEDLLPTESTEGAQHTYLVDKLQKPSYISENPSLKARIDSIFSGDFSIIENQVNKWANFKLIQDSIKSKKLISSDLLESMIGQTNKDRKSSFITKYKKKFGNNYFCRISIPVYSRDKKMFMIDVNYLGSGRTLIYKKKKDKWIRYTISNWIS